MKKIFLLISGGTGGHIIPAKNLANYILNKGVSCSILTDKRGHKYINKFKGNIYLVKSSNLNGNIFSKFLGIIYLILGFFQSFLIILKLKPTIVISFGSYASFTPVLCCLLLKPFFNCKIFIHEQNSVLGRTNKFFLKYINKLFLNFNILSKINKKFHNKTFVVGSPEKNNLDYTLEKNKCFNDQFTIFFFGGSQGSEYITNFAIHLIKKIDRDKMINVKFIIQSPKHLIENVKNSLKQVDSNLIVQEYFNDIDEVLNNTSLVVSRAGAGTVTDLINHSIPSILIPLPSSKDNHQYYNALIMNDHEVAIILDQKKNEFSKAEKYIYKVYNDKYQSNLNYKIFDKIKVKNSNSMIYNLATNEKKD